MRRSEAQHSRQTYLSEMARKRHQHEESKMSEYQVNMERIREREASLHSVIAEVDHQSEQESLDSGKNGLAMLAQMNGDLESLIRNVYAKMLEEQNSSQAAQQQTIKVSQ